MIQTSCVQAYVVKKGRLYYTDHGLTDNISLAKIFDFEETARKTGLKAIPITIVTSIEYTEYEDE